LGHKVENSEYKRRKMNQKMAKSRLLITGIAGFTGNHLARYFTALGYEVFGTTIDEPRMPNHFRCDLRDRDAIRSAVDQIQPTHVIHLAAISFVAESNASLIYDVNVISSCNLLDALTGLPQAPQKVILASSATVYGDQGCEVLDESMCPRPVNHYGCSKLVMEQMASTYFSKLPIIITRPFNYTGPGQEGHFLIPKIISHFKERKGIIELGNLHVEREFNDIRDVCDIYAKLLTCDTQNETINLCTGRGVTLLSVIDRMNEIAGYEIDVQVNPAFVRPNEIKRLVGSVEKLTSLIGTLEPRSIKDTLLSMYEV
jgi:nucleoside-diphosphate-sugar epimerase